MLEFKILGPLQVHRDGDVVELGGRKQRAVLAALVLEANHVVSLDRLLDQLWPGEPPATATATLQTYVSQLRRLLEPERAPRAPATVLMTQPPGYLLRVAPEGLDATRFDQLTTAGHAALASGDVSLAETLLAEALALWRGDPLADLAGEDFALPSATRLFEMEIAAREDLVDARLALGRHSALVGELERLVAAHPLRERLRGQLMLAFYRSGRQADALRVYAEGRNALADELGLDPGPALQQLELDILQQSPDLDCDPGDCCPPQPRVITPVAIPSGRPETAAPAATTSPAPATLLFGRDTQVARLDERIAEACAGRGGLVLVTGEAGIGKTQLAEAVAAGAEARGMRVAWSRCDEFDGAPAFWPWTQLLRRLLGAGGLPALDARTAPALQLVPELAPAPPQAAEDNADAARFVLYDAVTALLAQIATQQPVMVVVDDIHWADASSLRLLQFVAGEASRLPLLVLATDREEDRANPVVAETLASLARERGVGRISLRGLGCDDVHSWLTAAADRDVDPALAEVVHDRTGGNPFFVVELLRLLNSERRLDDPTTLGVPAGVRDVLGRRFARLPEPTRAVLQLAAVAGREFSPEVLGLAGGLEVDDVLDALEPAMLARLVVDAEEGFGCFRFSHALVREALYETLAPVRRARLHRQLGRAYETRAGADPSGHVTELAYHFSEAASGGATGAAAAALEWTTKAAEQARERLAYDEAVTYWRHALAALELDRPGDLVARYDIVLELAQSLHRTGDVVSCQRVVAQARDLARRLDDPVRVARAAAVFGGVALWNWRAYGEVDVEAVSVLERAARELPADEHELRAKVLGSLGVELMYSDRAADAEAYGREGVEVARALKDPVVLARALNNHFRGMWVPGREDERLAAAAEMVELAPFLSPAMETVGRMHLMMELLRRGDVPAWRGELDRCRRLAEQIALPEVHSQLGWQDACEAALEGRFDEAERLTDEAFESQLRTNVWGAYWCRSVQLVTIRRHQGRLGELADGLATLAVAGENELIRPLAVYAAAASGDEAGARRLLARWPIDEPRRDWSWQFTATVWAEVAVLLGDPGPARYAELLAGDADRLVVAGTSVGCWGSTHLFLGRLAARSGALDAAVDHLEAAVARNATAGAVAWEAVAAAELAGVLEERDAPGDAARAEHERLAARLTADRLAMAPVADGSGSGSSVRL